MQDIKGRLEQEPGKYTKRNSTRFKLIYKIERLK